MALNDESTPTEALSARLAALEQELAALHEREYMYRQALDAVGDMVLVKGADSHIVYANQAFRTLYGMTEEQLRDLIDAPFNDPDTTQQYIRDDVHVFETGQVLTIPQEPVTRYDGVQRIVMTVKSPIMNATGQIVMTVGVFRDITEQLQTQTDAQIYETVFKHLPNGVMVFQLEQPDAPRSFRLIAANPMAKDFTGVDLEAEIGRPAIDVFPGIDAGMLAMYAEIVQTGQGRDLGEVAYGDNRVEGGFFSVRALPLPNQCVGVMFENVTERKRTEEMLRQSIAQEETIRAQQAALAEISTPLIPINDRVMVMPLIGAMDSRRAQQVIETLLEGIATSGAQVAILDITGVALVDTQVADALIRAAQAVQLLGAQVVLTGIRPEVAQTLVGLGIDLSKIITRSNLQSGIAYAERRGDDGVKG